MEASIRAIIIDDEAHNADLLHYEISDSFPDVEVVRVCYSAKEGLKAIKELSPDLIFLDIEMPVMSGFEILEFTPNTNFHVIFTTAHSEYALKAIRTSAVDYLLKPITRDDLDRAMAAYRKRRGEYDQNIAFLLNQLEDVKQNRVTKLALPTPDGLIFLQISEIIYFQSDDVYTFVKTTKGKQYFLNKTMKTIEDMIKGLPFYRVHRSYIINLSQIRKFIKADGGYLLMENGESIPIARSRKDEFLNRLNEM